MGLDACGTIRARRRGVPPKHATFQSMVTRSPRRMTSPSVHGRTLKLSWCFRISMSNRKGAAKEGRGPPEGGHCACLFGRLSEAHEGVDLLDQMVGYYLFNHRSKKWWRRLFFFFLTVSCYNSFVVGRSAGWKAGYKDWVEDMAMELVTDVRV